MSRSNRKLWADFVRNQDKQGSRKTATPQPAVVTGRRGRNGIFLGIDPSLRGTGLAVVDCRSAQQFTLLFSETVRINPKIPMTACLGEIFQHVEALLEQFPIAEVAVEQAIYVQNFQTAMTLGSARGAALAAVSRKGLPITEYPPLRIKQAVVGYGRASKEQMIRTLQNLLHLPTPIPSDEADAAGAAICHAFTAQAQ